MTYSNGIITLVMPRTYNRNIHFTNIGSVRSTNCLVTGMTFERTHKRVA
jgi:hypothetical protein